MQNLLIVFGPEGAFLGRFLVGVLLIIIAFKLCKDVKALTKIDHDL